MRETTPHVQPEGQAKKRRTSTEVAQDRFEKARRQVELEQLKVKVRALPKAISDQVTLAVEGGEEDPVELSALLDDYTNGVKDLVDKRRLQLGKGVLFGEDEDDDLDAE